MMQLSLHNYEVDRAYLASLHLPGWRAVRRYVHPLEAMLEPSPVPPWGSLFWCHRQYPLHVVAVVAPSGAGPRQVEQLVEACKRHELKGVSVRGLLLSPFASSGALAAMEEAGLPIWFVNTGSLPESLTEAFKQIAVQ